MTTDQPNLLRRTAATLVAVAGFFISAGSQAATVTLTGATSNSCTYSAMSVQPDGSFSVTCLASTVTPGSPGALSLSQPADVTSSTPVSVTAFRTGGTTGAATAQFSVSGAGCTAATGALSWADGDGAGKVISVSTLVSGSCTVALSAPTVAALGTPASVTFNVTAPTTTPPVNSACPTGYTEPQGLLTATLGGPGNPLLQMQASNQVVSIPLPDPQPNYSTGQVSFSESAGGAYTPQPVTLNITISKCRGLVDTDYNNRCNLTSSNGNYNSVTWFAQPYSIITGPAPANLRGYCWAPKSEGQWYINAKWTYSVCAFGAQVCGFAIVQNYGPY